MPTSAAPLSHLRQLLAARFPTATRPAGAALRTGLPAVDQWAEGLPRGALTELVSAGPSAGSHLFLAQLLAATRTLPARVALVDASDQFDPRSIPPADLEHLVWVRCRTGDEALPAADLLARDANFDLLVLDVAARPLRLLQRIPSQAWYRLQRAVEQSDLALLVLTPAPLVPSAQLRFELTRPHALAAQDQARPDLAAALHPAPLRQRLFAQG